MAEQRGSVLHDRRDGWYVQFRSVRWPGDAKGRRLRIHRVPGFGKIENEAQGYKVLYRIWAEVADGKPLHQVLSWYVSEHAPQNLWLRRWRLFCDYKEADVRSGHLSARRVYDALCERGIYVRYFDSPRLENALRISVGTEDETDALLASLEEIVAG